MSYQAVGLALFLVAFAGFAGTALLCQRAFLDRYAIVRPGRIHPPGGSSQEFGADPVETTRRLPRETAKRIDALLERTDEPDLERARRLAVALFATVGAWLLIGLPMSMVAAAVGSSLPTPLGPLPGIVLTLAWAVLLTRTLRRRTASFPFVVAGVIGASIGVLLVLVAIT